MDYALEAAIFVTGAAVQWLRDGLGIIRTAAETEELARSLDVQRRRLSRAGLHRPRLAALGPVRARRGARPHARDGAGAPGAGGAGGDGLPGRRRGAGDGGGVGRGARRAQGRRRRRGQRLADAVPSRRARRAGGGAERVRDDRPRRGLPRRRGHRACGREADVARHVAPRRALRAVAAGRRARRAVGGWRSALARVRANVGAA